MRTSAYSLRDSILLFVLLAAASVGTILLSNLIGVVVSMGVLGFIAFVSVFSLSYRYPRYNILILLCFNFFIALPVRVFELYEIPLGIINDSFCVIMIITLILNKRISGLRTIPAALLGIWILYLALELVNPNSSSRVAGFLAIRSWALFICSFFIMYSSIDSKKDVNLFLSAWMLFGFVAGTYGLCQEFIGLPYYDFTWATSDEERYGLLFTWGRLRKFSFFFSPTEFGMLMSFTGMAALIAAFYVKEQKLKILAVISAFVCLWAMIYTGSRTAMVILPVGLLIFAAITLHRKTLLVVAFLFVSGTFFMLRPSSGAMWVMSTAFSGSDDPSMNVRIRNREIIRSYIQSNPIGYGLGGTGYLGRKYSGNTFIGTFATDSEYVRLAVETGWIGLFLWCVILATLFGYGVSVYFKAGSLEWKPILTLILVLFFMIMVSHYTQEIFVSTTISILYAGMIGILARIDSKIGSKSKGIPDIND